MINVNELGPGIAIYFGKGLKFHLAETTIYGFILEVISRLTKGKTLIVIAHRLSTTTDSDQIVVSLDRKSVV